MRTVTIRRLVAPGVLTLIVAAVACGQSSRPAVESPPSAPVSLPPPPRAPAENDAAAPADASAEPDAAADAATDAPSTPLVGVRVVAFRPGAPPPVGVNGAHGATVWAVTLAASAGPSPELTALFQQTQTLRLASSVGEVTCTPAVGGPYPGTLPSGDSTQIVTVTFRSERDARRFAAALTETPLRIGRVRVGCAD